MNKSDQLKLEIIAKFVSKSINIKLASKALDVSQRTIHRYAKKFLNDRANFLIHGNKFKPSKNAYSNEFKDKIMNVLIEKYYDYNVQHAYEKLIDSKIFDLIPSYKTLLRWSHEKKFIKKMNRKKRAPKARKRMPKTGIMLQLDGSTHQWFGDKKSTLIAAIDDANNEIPFAEFCRSENTLDCMKVLQNIIEKKGVFSILYVDKAGLYGGTKRQDFSQIERACSELGIKIVYAHSAEAKGRIERFWKTAQSRIVPEMRTNGIKTFKEANNYLKNDFMPNTYNKKFKLDLNLESDYRKTIQNLNEIFCIKDYRNINGDQTFYFKNNKYLIHDFPGNLRGKIVEIRKYQNEELSFYFQSKKLKTEIIGTNSQLKAA